MAPFSDQGRAVQRHERGPDHPEGENRSRWFLDFSVRAVLNVFPYEISLGSELRSQIISEKIQVLQPAPSSVPRVLLIRVPSFQTGSGQTGFLQKWHKSYTCCHMSFKCAHLLSRLPYILQHLATSDHILPWQLIMGNRGTSVMTPFVLTPPGSCQQRLADYRGWALTGVISFPEKVGHMFSHVILCHNVIIVVC